MDDGTLDMIATTPRFPNAPQRARARIETASRLGVRSAYLLLTLVLASGCNRKAPSNGLAVVNAAFRELRLPAASEGVLSREGAWRVFVDRSGSARRLLVIHLIAALQLPDAPFELTAPLTYFRFEKGQWRQGTQARGGTAVPMPVETALATEFVDRSRVYFYRVRAIELASPDEPDARVAERIRFNVRDVAREAVELHRIGFIGADAEP